MKLQSITVHSLEVTDDKGYTFRLEDTQHGKIRITVPEDRIQYRTEEGFNNADFLELTK